MSQSAAALSQATPAREAMIESQLKPCGIVAPTLITAFYNVSRAAFVDPARKGVAYVDAAQPLGDGRELMAPISLGHLLEAAAPMEDDLCLVIAAGTGYSAAILARMTHAVVAVEPDAGLAARARENLSAFSNAEVVEGPMEEGHAARAPYSLLLIDGAIEQSLPASLVAQLAEGGRAAAVVVGNDGVARASIGRKVAGNLRLEPFEEAPASVLPPFRKAPAFRF